jgi:hypothetical protein
MKVLYVKILLLILSLSSCENNWGKYGGYKMEYESAMEYYIALDKGEVIYASDTKAESLKKGTIVKYHRSSGCIDSVLLGKESIIIEAFVDADRISYNSTFILLAQKPLDRICECIHSCLENTYQDRNDLPTYKLCKEALKKSTFYQYWIIDKTKDSVYGPYTKEEFLQKHEELGVPKGLKLKE